MKKNKTKKTYSKKNNIVYYSVTGAAVLGIILGAGLPWLKVIDTTPTPVSHEDKGEKIDHIFEYEEGNIQGLSGNASTKWDHFCTNKSFYLNPQLSGSACVRNMCAWDADETTGLEANYPTNTFTFTSDKTYTRLTLEICIASKYVGNTRIKWGAATLADAFTYIGMNDKKLNYETVSIPTSQSSICLGNYYNMQVVSINNVRIEEGTNTLVFKHSTAFLNVDYVNLITSANIMYQPTMNIDPDDVTITGTPTISPATTSATCTAKCNQSGCTSPDTFTLPCLAKQNGYDVEYTEDNKCIYTLKLLTKTETYETTARAVGQDHNELKKGQDKCVTLYGKDLFDPTNWTFDDGTVEAKLSAIDIVDNEGNLVAEKTTEIDTSMRTNLFYVDKVVTSTTDATTSKVTTKTTWKHLFHGGDALADLTEPLYQKQFSYHFVINATGPFRMAFGAVQGALLDLSNAKTCIGLDFNSDGSLGYRVNDSKATHKSPATPATGTSEIKSAASLFTFNEDVNVTVAITRYDAAHLTFRIYINDVEVQFTSTIESTDARASNLYCKEGRFIHANKFTTSTSGGQRFGLKTLDSSVVYLKDFSYEQTTDTWDPSLPAQA